MNDPRKLTDDEIIYLLNSIPSAKSPIEEVREKTNMEIKKSVRMLLEDIVITPLGIEDLKNEIIRRYEVSVVKNNQNIGSWTTTGIARPAMQMTLNSFHSSGLSKDIGSAF